MSSADLSQIKGIKPKKLLQDGEDMVVKSMTSSAEYRIKRTGDHYYCTCPAWRNQSKAPINARSCKHLRSVLGDAYEDARVGVTNSKTAASAKNKRKRNEDDDVIAKRTRHHKKKDDEDEEDEDEDGKEDANAVDLTKADVPALLLAVSWKVDEGQDITGWWMSEKLDGVRVFYDGKRFISRLGNPYMAPKWFLNKLPKDVALDGELFAGRGNFPETVSIVKTMNSPKWSSITLQLFDIPSMGDRPFEARMEALDGLFGPSGSHTCPEVKIVKQIKAKNKDHVLSFLKDIESQGGEGVMLREPGSEYEGRRSATLQKLKSFYDAEARVIGYEPGKGKHKGSVGSLRCVMASGKKFSVGSGLSDRQRQHPPKVGSIIVYRFQELTKDGCPRFPTFLGEAADKKEPKDAEMPAHRKGKDAAGDEG